MNLVAGEPSPPGTPPASKGAVPILVPAGGGPFVRADGAVFIELECPSGASVAYGGFLIIETPGGVAKKSASKAKAIGKARYSVKPGKKAQGQDQLNSAARAKLRRKHRLAVTIKVKLDRGAPVSTFRRTLKPRRTKRR